MFIRFFFSFFAAQRSGSLIGKKTIVAMETRRKNHIVPK